MSHWSPGGSGDGLLPQGLSLNTPPGTQSGWEKSQVIKAVVTSCGFAFGLSWVEVPAPPLIGYVASVS